MVDDEESVVRLIQDLLSALKCRTYSATTGAEAVRIGCDVPLLDLLIADLVMPEVDGFEVAQRVVPIHPAVKVILMSGYSPKQEFLQMVDNKRFFYVAKPLAPTAFIRQVRRVLGLEAGAGTRTAGRFETSRL